MHSAGYPKKEISVSAAPKPQAEEIKVKSKEAFAGTAEENGIVITEPAGGEEVISGDYDYTPVAGRRAVSSRLLWLGLGAGFLAVLAGVILLTTVFARLTVTINPRLDQITVADTVMALDTSLSRPLMQQRVVPAQFLEFSRKETEEFEATGKEFIEERARGKVKIYNRFSSSPQTLVASTRFMTDSGILFRLARNIVIPGAKIEEGKIIPESIEAELIADKAGDDSNTPSEVVLKIPGFKGTAKYDGFYASAPSGFSGGFRGEARVVSQDDLRLAQEAVTKNLHEGLRQEIARKIPPDFKLIEGLREIQITNLDSPRPKTRRDRFSIEAEARGRVLVFREKDVAAVIKERFKQEDAGRLPIEESEELNYQVRVTDFVKKRGELIVRGSFKAVPIIQQQELAALIKSKKEGSILEILKGRKEVADFAVSFFPPWLFKAPGDTDKIKVIIKEP